MIYVRRANREDEAKMIDEVLDDLQKSADKAHESLKRDLAKLRTGRAHPSMLDSIRVDYYGQMTPVSQMATVSVPEPRMLVVKPWEKNQAQGIDKAIREGDLGLNPQLDGDTIRVPIPPLSEERRKDLVKIARKQGEECKVAVRKARHEANDVLDTLKKEGEASEDDVERGKKKVEELVSAGGAVVDQIVLKKEQEILEV
jgi:ribosome recycling factor